MRVISPTLRRTEEEPVRAAAYRPFIQQRRGRDCRSQLPATCCERGRVSPAFQRSTLAPFRAVRGRRGPGRVRRGGARRGCRPGPVRMPGDSTGNASGKRFSDVVYRAIKTETGDNGADMRCRHPAPPLEEPRTAAIEGFTSAVVMGLRCEGRTGI